jgi:hypothetical protein
MEPLLRLEEGRRLCGRYVEVRNAGALPERDETRGSVEAVPIGDARAAGNAYVFEPSGGGPRMDKDAFRAGHFRWRYVQASHFGEVNTYYHLDRIGAYVDDLLAELRCGRLPRVVARVHAHHAATERDGIRDGVWHGRRWLPFQGGHYRLSSRAYDVVEEREPVSETGEIHLGPGYRLLQHGALVEAAGTPYRHNASHNAGILYHEYGHHIVRHTADLWANGLRHPQRQKNRKTALDEGTCDYWAATMLGTPHIWCWHRRHDEVSVHPRSLTSRRTMADFDEAPDADPHTNGTIWASALWDLRSRLTAADPVAGPRRADMMVLQMLLLLGTVQGEVEPPTIASVRRARLPFTAGLAALLQADELLHGGRERDAILASCTARGIRLAHEDETERRRRAEVRR